MLLKPYIQTRFYSPTTAYWLLTHRYHDLLLALLKENFINYQKSKDAAECKT